MRRFSILIAMVIVAAILGVVQTGLVSDGVAQASQTKLNICHIDEEGIVHTINIAEPANKAHITHGDYQPITFYEDTDGDVFGNPDVSLDLCEQPEGYVNDNTDCDDSDVAIYPGALEIPYDGIDQDCNGQDLTDVDEDGYDGGIGGPDCDDANAATYPGAEEINDGLDNDCDGVVPGNEIDDDGDGLNELDGDCDDTNANVRPGLPEIPGDGLDNDCDPSTSDTPLPPFYGVQHNLPESDLTDVGYERCYFTTYGTASSRDTILPACTKEHLVFAASETWDTEVLFIAAAVPRNIFFNPTPCCNGAIGREYNGVYWYYVQRYSMGFAPSNSFRLNSCDYGYPNLPLDQDSRLCWHMHGWVGGWSAGSNIFLNSDSRWYKVVYQAGAEAPAPLGVVAMGATSDDSAPVTDGDTTQPEP